MDTYDWVASPQWIDVSYGYKECLKKAFGFDFFPIVKINGTEDISNSYDFYLKIRIKNQKYIQAGAYTLNGYDPLGDDEPAPSDMDPFTFYNSSEIKLKAFDPDVPGLAETQERMLRGFRTYIYRFFLFRQRIQKMLHNGDDVRQVAPFRQRNQFEHSGL